MAVKLLMLIMSPDTLNRESFGSLFFFCKPEERITEYRQDPGKKGADLKMLRTLRKCPYRAKEVTMSYINRHFYQGTVTIRIANHPKMRYMKAMARAARREAGLPVTSVSFFIPVNSREWRKIATL